MFSVVGKSYLSLKDVESGLKKCDCIRYAAYRTAAKLRVLQKAFCFDKVQLRVISCIFERHQLQQTENSVQLHQKEVESVLSDIYFAVKKASNVCLDADYFSQMVFSLLLNIFDKKTSNTIQVFSFKVALTLLCEAKPREKYHYLFEQLADHNNCLSRKKLEILLKKIISLTEYLGEGLSFGSALIPGTVESCFQCNIGSLGLSEDVFMSWLMQDPQLLVWISTLYRMQISESVLHNAKCEICKICPLGGLRYRCLRCLSYDMCQSCFFTGKQNKRHKLRHPVQEYCCPMTSQQSTKAFLLTLKNKLCKKDCKLQYLPALRVDPQDPESLGESTRLLDEMDISSRTVVNGSRISSDLFPFRELQNIIFQLETETRKIIPQLNNFCRCGRNDEGDECRTRLRNCLANHNAQVRAQVQRLKLLRNYLASSEKSNGKAFVASTPVFDENSSKSQKRNLRVNLVNLSPITVGNFPPNCERKMMWDNYELGGENLLVLPRLRIKRKSQRLGCRIPVRSRSLSTASLRERTASKMEEAFHRPSPQSTTATTPESEKLPPKNSLGRRQLSFHSGLLQSTYSDPSWEEFEIGNRESDSGEASEVRSKINAGEEAAREKEENTVQLSALLSGKSLRELDSTSGRGITWLESESRTSEEEKFKDENEEALQELQCDLRKILSKLQELSVLTSGGEAHEADNEYEKKSTETDVAFEVDALLVDLISGIEKLTGN